MDLDYQGLTIAIGVVVVLLVVYCMYKNRSIQMLADSSFYEEGGSEGSGDEGFETFNERPADNNYNWDELIKGNLDTYIYNSHHDFTSKSKVYALTPNKEIEFSHVQEPVTHWGLRRSNPHAHIARTCTRQTPTDSLRDIQLRPVVTSMQPTNVAKERLANLNVEIS